MSFNNAQSLNPRAANALSASRGTPTVVQPQLTGSPAFQVDNIDPSLRDFLHTQTTPRNDISLAPNRVDQESYTSMRSPSSFLQQSLGARSRLNDTPIRPGATPRVTNLDGPRVSKQAHRRADALATGRKRKESDTSQEENEQEKSRELKARRQASAKNGGAAAQMGSYDPDVANIMDMLGDTIPVVTAHNASNRSSVDTLPTLPFTLGDEVANRRFPVWISSALPNDERQSVQDSRSSDFASSSMMNKNLAGSLYPYQETGETSSRACPQMQNTCKEGPSTAPAGVSNQSFGSSGASSSSSPSGVDGVQTDYSAGSATTSNGPGSRNDMVSNAQILPGELSFPSPVLGEPNSSSNTLTGAIGEVSAEELFRAVFDEANGGLDPTFFD